MKLKRLAAGIIAAVMTASSVTVNVFADSGSNKTVASTENVIYSGDDEEIVIPSEDDEDTDEIMPPIDSVEPVYPVVPFDYDVLADRTVEIRGYSGNSETVEIPSEINGMSVTSIGDHAFEDCTNITSITIPDSVAHIGWYAFYDCISLTSITIPESVTSIGIRAFSGCESLTSIAIPDSVTYIGWCAFEDCTSLISITISDSVTNIDMSTFQGCISLTSITIPDGVTVIDQSAFEGCKSLVTATIPDSVESIGGWVFYGCTSLTSITIPDGVTAVGEETFYGCKSLKSITIPDSVTDIGEKAFYGCKSLTSITIPDGVTRIESMTFYDCMSLTSITIPDSVTEIGWNAFFGCLNLKSITIPDSVTSIDSCAFERCISLTSITIPDGVTEISGLFSNCTNLKSITIPDSVTEIGKNTFSGCTSLTGIKIPNSVTEIGEYTFSGCTSLTSIKIPNSVTEIGEFAFYGCKSLASVTIPDGVTSISDGAFERCTSLKSITIPDSVTSIGWSAFSDCISLTSITIPDGVPNIDGYTFSGCSSLTSITIPDSVTSIGQSAFEGCTSLISIVISKDVTSIIYTAFLGCSKLTTIDVEVDNNYYSSVDGMLFDKDKKEIICYPAGKTETNFDIPIWVRRIGKFAFAYSSNLTSIKIPSSVTSIRDGAFSNCLSLTTVDVAEENPLYSSANGVLFDKDKKKIIYYPNGKTDNNYSIPDSVTSIGESTFSNCLNLTSVVIPDSVIEIGNNAFENSLCLTSITIPKNVTSIRESAFRGCARLTNITILSGVKSIGKLAFLDCASLTNVTIPDSVTSIGESAFRDCTSLTSIVISNSLTKINDYTFDGCINLTSVTIPDSVTSIGMCAFNGCINLTSVKIPYSVTNVGYEAFFDCPNLLSITILTKVTNIDGWALGYNTDDYYEALYDTLFSYSVKKTDNFKIYCFSGTAGEQYAKKEEFEYELVYCNEHHYTEWKILQAATCTENGTKVRICTACGEEETAEIIATGHIEVTDSAVAAACTETGLTEGTHCSVCGTVIKAQETVPATGKHDFNNWKTTKAATYTATGTKTRTCKVCKKTETATIAKLTLAKIGGFKVKAKDSTSITLQWNKNNSASGYIIEAYNGKTWSQVAKITKNSTLTYKVTKLSASKTYQYRIKAYKTEGKATAYSANSATLSVNTNPTNISGFKAKAKSYNSITLQWNKNTSATGYELQKWDGKKWVSLTKISKNSTTTYTVKSLKASTNYKYRIRAYKTIGKTTQYSAYTATLSVNTNPSNMSGFKVKSTAKTSVTLQWNKNTSATGYEIQKWNGKKWVSAAKVTKNSTVTSTVRSLKANTSYKFRIRAYKTIGKTTQYSSWSGTLTVKTKK